MKTGRKLFTTVALFFTLVLGVSAFAQKLEKASATGSLHVPGWALINSTVHVSGFSIPMGSKKVTLTIVDPSGKTNILIAPIGSDGGFAADFKGTKLVGMYAVHATAPDKKGKADTSFIVSGPLDMSKHAVHKTVELLSKMAKGVPLLEQQVLSLSPSPAREKAMEKLEVIRADLQEGTVRAGNLQVSLAAVASLAASSPSFSEALEPAFEDMSRLSDSVDDAQAELEEKLALWGSTRPTLCDNLDTAAAGLDMYAGFVTFLTAGWKQILVDVTEKNVMDRWKLIPNKNVSGTDVMMAKSVLKTAEKSLGEGWSAWLDDSAGLMASGASWLAGKFLGLYCVHYKGDFKAHFGAQYFAYGKKWWAYNIDLTGKLNLRYQKTDGGGPIQVTGEFEGNAGNFKVMEDLLVATPYMKRYVVFSLALGPPPPLPGQKELANEFGKVGRVFAGPYSFLVPVHGIIDGDKMILQIDPAKKDYGDLVKGRVWYVMLDPTSPLPIPYIMETELPMVKAQFILSRGTRGKPSFKIKVGSDVSTINRTFTRTEKDDKGNYKVVWKVQIKACNPSCG